jgi:hypothetical protein
MGQVSHAVSSPNCVLKSLLQTRDVRVVKFVIENSIEQRILEIQQRKNVRTAARCTPNAGFNLTTWLYV